MWGNRFFRLASLCTLLSCTELPKSAILGDVAQPRTPAAFKSKNAPSWDRIDFSKPVPVSIRFDSTTSPEDKQYLMSVVDSLAFQTDSNTRYFVKDTATLSQRIPVLFTSLDSLARSFPHENYFTILAVPGNITQPFTLGVHFVGCSATEDPLFSLIPLQDSGYYNGMNQERVIALSKPSTVSSPNFFVSIFIHETDHEFYGHTVGESSQLSGRKPTSLRRSPAVLEARARYMENSDSKRFGDFPAADPRCSVTEIAFRETLNQAYDLFKIAKSREDFRKIAVLYSSLLTDFPHYSGASVEEVKLSLAYMNRILADTSRTGQPR